MTEDGRARGARHGAVAAAAKLHRSRRRRETGLTLIEGPNLFEEAMSAGIEPSRVFASVDDVRTFERASSLGIEVTPVDGRALARLAGTDTPRGPVAVMRIPEDRLDPTRSLLVAWGVSEPGNLGALVRTAAAFGWGFGWTHGSADPWSPKALRAGAGGQFRAPVARVESTAAVSSWETVAAIPAGGADPSGLGDGPWAVLIGEEGAGLPAEIVAACAHTVTIRMPGRMESLNAAVAAGILVYELSGH